MDGEEILAMEKVSIEDEAVQAEIAKLQLPEGTNIVCDPWIYGIPVNHTKICACGGC